MNDRDPSALLEVRHLTKNYYHLGVDVPVLKDVSLTIHRGDLISIVGKSGVGKSTFLHVVGTLDRPTSGEVLYQGRNVFDLPDKALATFRNHKLGFVFQFHHLLPEFTALENVMMPALVARDDPEVAAKRAGTLLNRVGLEHRSSHRPGELSGGEQQRVAIARSLMMNPEIVLADEPTGNLDERTSEEINELLFELNRSLGLALVVVTHSVALARRMTRCFEMHQGDVIPLRDSQDL